MKNKKEINPGSDPPVYTIRSASRSPARSDSYKHHPIPTQTCYHVSGNSPGVTHPGIHLYSGTITGCTTDQK